MKFRPLHDRILVRRVQEEEKTRGGIIIPDTARETPQEAVVVAAGPGRTDEHGALRPMEVSKGDRVLLGRWAGSEVTLDEQEHVIVRQDDVLAVIDRAGS